MWMQPGWALLSQSDQAPAGDLEKSPWNAEEKGGAGGIELIYPGALECSNTPSVACSMGTIEVFTRAALNGGEACTCKSGKMTTYQGGESAIKVQVWPTTS